MRSVLEDRALVVLHRLEASLAAYDACTGQERFRVPTGPYPHEVCLSPDRTQALVSEYGLPDAASEGEGGNSIGVFDLRRAERVGTIGLGRYHRPHGLAAHSGGRLFVTCESQRTLLILRTEDHSILHAVDVGQDLPHLAAVSPDGRTAFTANLGAGTLTAVDVMMGEVLSQVKGLDRPEGMAFSPDGRLLCVANRRGDALSIVDTTRLDVIARVPTGHGPMRVAVTPDGRRGAFALYDDDAVQVIDLDAREVAHTVPVGRGPAATAMSADGRVLFASCEADRRVFAIDLARAEVAGEIATGEGPDGMMAVDLGEVA
jgi:YVTN family beta-propeller protein